MLRREAGLHTAWHGLALCLLGAATALSSGCEPIGASSSGLGADAPCDVPACGSRGSTLGLARYALAEAPALSKAPAVMTRVTREMAQSTVDAAFAENGLAAQVLIYWARIDRGALPGDAHWPHDFPQPDRADARWLAAALDRAVPGWQQVPLRAMTAEDMSVAESTVADVIPALLPSEGAEAIDSKGQVASVKQALQTQGCGEMRLQLSLNSVKVNARDDNFSGDRVYCIIQSSDDNGVVEAYQSEASPPLDPFETHRYADGVYYGRDVGEGTGRDPGERLKVQYDCFELDDASDYQEMRKLVERANQVAKYFGPQAVAFVGQVSTVVNILISLGELFDGDDHLYRHSETLSRQGLWALMLDGSRNLAMSGTHSGSDWSWLIELGADGCAAGFDTRGGGGGASGGGAGGGGGGSCGPDNCDGCCLGDTCLGGRSTDQCGNRGQQCESCEAYEQCGAGTCAFNQLTPFDVEVNSGVVADGCWDAPCGAPEPYVVLRSGSHRGESALRRDTLRPNWGGVAVLHGVPASSLLNELRVTIIDDDLSFDDNIGNCTVNLTEAQLIAGEHTFTCGSIRLSLNYRAR